MAEDAGLISVGEVLAGIEDLMNRLDPERPPVDAQTQLEWVTIARSLRARLDAIAALLIADADRTDASLRVDGTPTTSWLGMKETLSRREAAGVVHQARALRAHPVLAEAALAGRVGGGQARAITRVLDSVAGQLDAGQRAQAEHVLVDLAEHLDGDQLARSAEWVLEQVAPVDADQRMERVLQRQNEVAHQQRALRFIPEGASVRFAGSLPRIDAEQWIALLEAHTRALQDASVDIGHPVREIPTLEQRRADALVSMVQSARGTAPGMGSARILVRLDYHRLQSAAAAAGLIADGQPLSAGDLRRLCCDAELIPTVLGSDSEVLDVGRAVRLVTPAIRIALIQRDQGCAFPGCDIPPGWCDAHHVQPWSAGGHTKPSNLVLLCHQHHSLVEPAKHGVRDQWQVRIAGDALPEFIPPSRLDPTRTPVRHQRQIKSTTVDPLHAA